MRLFMNRPVLRKVYMDFAGNKRRSVLVVLSIAIGIFALGLVFYLQETLRFEMNNSWKEVNYPNIIYNNSWFKEDLVYSVARLPGVECAQGRTEQNLTLRKDGSTKPVAAVFYPNDLNNVKLMKIQVLQGTWPPRSREFFAEKSSADYAGWKIGDVIEFSYWSNRKFHWKLVGLIHDGEVTAPAMQGGRHSIYLGNAAKSEFEVNLPYSRLLVKLLGEPTDKTLIEEAGKKIRKHIEHAGVKVWWVNATRADEHVAMEFINKMALMLGVLGIAALLLSGFLVFNTISAVLVQQTKQIGIMKAVGARRVTIVGIYVRLVMLFGIVALIVAVPASTLVSKILAGYIEQQFNIIPTSFFIPAKVFLLQLAVGLIVPLLASSIPVWRGTRMTAREAMATNGMDSRFGGRKLIDFFAAKMNRVSRPLLLSIRNTFRRTGRLALTLAVMVLAGTVFMSVMTVSSSLNRTLDNVMKMYDFDFVIYFNREYRIDKINSAMETVPNIGRVEYWGGSGGYRLFRRGEEKDGLSSDIQIFALSSDTKMATFQMLEGRWLKPDDQTAMVITNRVQKFLPGLKVGDKVSLVNSDNKKTEWTIVGVVNGGFTGPNAYVPYDYYAYKTNRVNMSYVAFGQMKGRADARPYLENIEQTLKRSGLGVGQIMTLRDELENIMSVFTSIIMLLAVMAALMGVIGALGLAGTMGMNVIERTREIGVMRSIGASSGQIRRIFLFEGVAISIIGWLCAVLLSLALGRVAANIVGNILFEKPLEYVFNWSGVIIWLAAAVIFGALASIIPARQATKISVRDAIAYE